MRKHHPGAAIATLLLTITVTATSARAEDIVQCHSDHGRYRYCQAETSNRVSLRRQLSSTACRQGENWGFDRHGVWVDRGCRAEFTVREDKHRNNNKDVAIAAGAVAAIAIAAAAASKHSRDDQVPSWAVGTFSGYDAVEGSDIELTILPGGSVTGHAGRHEFSGSYRDERLQAGRYEFRLARAGNGFVATDEKNAAHRVNFLRSGSGYGNGY